MDIAKKLTHFELTLDKNGILHSYDYDEETKTRVLSPVDNNNPLCHLYDAIDIDNDITVSKFLEFVRPFAEVLNPICGMWLVPLLVEYDKGVKGSDEEITGSIMFTKYMDYSVMEHFKHEDASKGDDWDDPYVTINVCGHVSLKQSDGECYSLSSLTAYDLRNCTMNFDPYYDMTRIHSPPTRTSFEPAEDGYCTMVSTPEYKQWDREKPFHKGLSEAFTIHDVLREFIMDLTFYGLGESRTDFFETLEERVSKHKKDK
jgi:hypothetical protein